MNRLTVDTPRNNLETVMNYAYAKDGFVYLTHAGGEFNIPLHEYLSGQAKAMGCEIPAKEILECGLCLECDCPVAVLNAVAIQAAELRARLKQYEDLEEAGRIVRLRAGIGDVVYAIIDGKVVPMQIQYLYINSNGRVRYHAAEAVLEKNFRDPAFGRDVFTTREAAERKVAGHAR